MLLCNYAVVMLVLGVEVVATNAVGFVAVTP